jgi:hypothetical protein
VQSFPKQLHHTSQEEEEYYTDSSMSKMCQLDMASKSA